MTDTLLNLIALNGETNGIFNGIILNCEIARVLTDFKRPENYAVFERLNTNNSKKRLECLKNHLYCSKTVDEFVEKFNKRFPNNLDRTIIEKWYYLWKNGTFDESIEANGGTRSDGVKVIITYNSLGIKGKFYFRPSKRVPCL